MGVATPVYVDFGYAGTEAGTQAEPFNSVLEGETFVQTGGTATIGAAP